MRVLASQIKSRDKKFIALIYTLGERSGCILKISKDLKSLTTTQTQMAALLGVTQPRVAQYIKDGIILKDESGAVLVIESLKNYYKYRVVGENVESDDGDVALLVEKARHEKAKRQIAELNLAKMKSELYDAGTVELVLTEMLSNLRSQLLGIPSKMAPMLDGADRDTIYSTLNKEIEDRLSELSEYTPELFTDTDTSEDSNDENS